MAINSTLDSSGKRVASKLYIESLQALRGIAAIAVVLHHARNPAQWLYNPLANYTNLARAVDIFFVLSGFFMFVVSRHSKPLQFVRKKIFRVAPLYWVATLFYFFVQKNHISLANSAELLHLFASLFFIPLLHPAFPEVNFPYPTLIVGWALNLEIFFYVLFAVGLFFARPILVSSFLSIGLFIIVHFLPSSWSGSILDFYGGFQILEFLAGIWIGYFYIQGIFAPIYSCCLPLGMLLLLFLDGIPQLLRVLAATAIVVGTLQFPSRLVVLPFARLGDSSYSLYLVHTLFPIYISTRIVSAFFMPRLDQFIIFMILTVLFSIVSGIFVHTYIEIPLIRLCSQLFDKRIVPQK